MSEPLFGYANGSANPLLRAAEKHIAALRDMELVRGQDELTVELVLFLAAAAARAKPYTLPAITKELREAMLMLPAPAEGEDLFEDLRQLLVDAAAEDAEP